MTSAQFHAVERLCMFGSAERVCFLELFQAKMLDCNVNVQAIVLMRCTCATTSNLIKDFCETVHITALHIQCGTMVTVCFFFQ